MDRFKLSPTSSSDSTSSEDEDKLRKLFQTCDRDNDGYITMDDLKDMCHQLHLEDSVEDIINHFNQQGLYNRISFEQFARCRMQLKPEIELQECRPPPPLPPRRIVTFATAANEDLSLFNNLYTLLEKSDPVVLKHITERIECAKTMQLCNSLHVASLHSLYDEKLLLQQEIAQLENDKCRYEERFTELQSVIAELRKKISLSCNHIDVIKEEDEEALESIENSDDKKNSSNFRVEDGMNNLHIQYSKSDQNAQYSRDDINEMKNELERLRFERDELQRKIDRSPNHYESIDAISPVKFAGKKKLKTVYERTTNLGSKTKGVESAFVAEQLVHDWQESSKIQEIIQGIGNGKLAEDAVKEFEIEIERLTSKIEHVKAQNNVLSLSLTESKAYSDRLSELLAKYESNQTALQISLANAEQSIECYQVLLALVTADKQFLLLNCRNNSTYSVDDVSLVQRSRNARKDAEQMAKRILHNHNHHLANRWESISTNSSNTTTTTTTSSGAETDDEIRLKDMIDLLSSERASVKSTVMDLESVHDIDAPPPHISSTQRLDLENAVLVQELLAVKEERSELRAQIHNLHKDKSSLQTKLYGKAEQETGKVNIDEIDKETNEASSSTLTLADLPSTDGIDEVLKREKRLKSRVHELVNTLERMSKNAEVRHQQSTDLVNELKNANSALITAFEKAKRKYQAKIKKLETKVDTVTGLYEAQVKSLKQRLVQLGDFGDGALLSNESFNQKSPPPSETSL